MVPNRVRGNLLIEKTRPPWELPRQEGATSRELALQEKLVEQSNSDWLRASKAATKLTVSTRDCLTHELAMLIGRPGRNHTCSPHKLAPFCNAKKKLQKVLRKT